MSRLVLFRQPLSAKEFAARDDGDSLLVVTPGALTGEPALLDAIAARISFAVAFLDAPLAGGRLAAALLCDWVTLTDDALLDLSGSAEISAAVALRLGRGALRLRVLSGAQVTAAEALQERLGDSLVRSGSDPLEWAREWIGGRSIPALTSGASLIRRRGGDRVERAEFARLFATGEPQQGLQQFLDKRRGGFAGGVEVEIV